MIHVYDQTDENSGTTVTNEMFGLNTLITVNSPDQALLDERYQELGATNLRFPGGSVTEWYFDISDIEGGSHDRSIGSFQGSELNLTPFTDFVQLAAELETDVTLVVPTINGFTQSAGESLIAGTYGQRMVSEEYLADVSAFIEMAVETTKAHGVDVSAIEIGNEFWGSGQMTAGEYGNLAAAMSQVIAETFTDLGIASSAQPDIVVQTLSAAGVFSPSKDMPVHVDEATGFVYMSSELNALDDEIIGRLIEVAVPSQGRAREQAREIIAAFDRDSVSVEDVSGRVSQIDISAVANEIDGVVNHYYLDGGFDAVNTEEQFGFNQLELWNNELASRDGTLADLNFYITEWNTRRHGAIDEANNRGLQQVSMDIEIFYEMVTHDVTAAHFWPVIFNYSNSGTLVFNSADALTIAGEGFSLMSESLVGLKPILDFRIMGEVAIHGYGDEDRLMLLLSERSGSENKLSLDLSDTISLDSDYYQVSWTELWDGGAGGIDEMARPVISKTQITELISVEEFNDFLLTMQAWSVVRMDIQGIDAADITAPIEVSKGHSARYVEGSNADDRLRGGLGDDTIVGGDGDNNMNGYEGNDLISGGSGNDHIKGGWGDDTLHGYGGDDTLKGDWGDDRLWGGSGNDRLLGGTGNDTLTGGEGADTFLGSLSELNGDTITDFSVGDRIVIKDSAFDLSALRLRGDGEILEIGFDGDGNADATIILEGEHSLERFEVVVDGSDTVIRYLENDEAVESETGTLSTSESGDTTLDSSVEGMAQLNVQVLDRAGNGLNETTVTFSSPEMDDVSGVNDSYGSYGFEIESSLSGHLDAMRGYDSEAGGHITIGDALDVLRLAVGLAPSWGDAAPMDFIAADINQDGRVSVADAMDIMRSIAGLESENQPSWIFLGPDIDLTDVGRDNTAITTGVHIDSLATGLTEITMTGVLLGNVQDSV